MNKQNPVVLFVGTEGQARSLQKRTQFDGWIIYRPEDIEDALALYLFEYPDVVVIQAGAVDFAREVYSHLRSVGGECILLLTDHPETWSISQDGSIRVAPAHPEPEAIEAEVRAKLGYGDLKFAL